MHIITELYKVDKCLTVVKENFKNNKRRWEHVDKATEYSGIVDGYYNMVNKSDSNWNYYKIKSGIRKDQDFIFQATIELQKHEDCYGHFGLLWGFDDEVEYLNRFTLSADGKRALVIHFEKNHKVTYHRFQTRNLPKVSLLHPIQFSVIRLGDYYYFLLNGIVVYSAHEYHFAKNGSHIGYYIESGITIRSNSLVFKKIKTKGMDLSTGLQQLLEA